MISLRKRFIKTAAWMVIWFAMLVILVTVVLLLLLVRSSPDSVRRVWSLLQSMMRVTNVSGTELWVYAALYLAMLIISTAAAGIWLLYRLSQSVIGPLNAIRESAENIRSGHLDKEILCEEDIEFFEVSSALDEARIRLKDSAAEQERAREERNMLAANISHDLRSPVTAIRGYLEGLRDGVADTPEKQKRYLDTVYAKTAALERVVDTMTEYSELELGRMQYRFEETDIAALLREAAEEYSMDAAEAGLKFDAELPEDAVICQADSVKLRRVTDNLMSNAVKYNKENGSILLKAQKQGDGFLIMVKDTGIGIAENETESVFNGFYRGSGVRAGTIKGSGLGLAIVRQIVLRHGGRIWLKSKDNAGTEAYVLLPTKDKE